MRIYMVRHGQSANNLVHRHSGWSQTELTEQGIEDARRAGRILSGIRFDKIYSSDLPRTMQTCRNALPGQEFEPLDLIREINIGSLQDRLIKDCEAEYGVFYIERRSASDYTPWGGENKEIVQQRARRFLKKMEESDYEAVAAFSHGVFIRCTMEVIQGENMAPGTPVPGNGAVAVFEYADGMWKALHWNRNE